VVRKKPSWHTEEPSLGGVEPLGGEWMTPRRRFLSAVTGGRVDKVPAATLSSVVTLDGMDLVDAHFPEAHLDAEMMARLAATAHEQLDLDTVMPVFHSQLEASALDADTWWGERDNWPAPKSHVLTDPEDFRIPNDYLNRPSFEAALGAIRLLRLRYPDVGVVGKVYGAWSVGFQLVGIENWLMMTITEPDKIHRFLEVLLPASLMSARAQFEAGADVVMWCDHANRELVSPETYVDFLLDMHREIATEIGGPSILHCCGETTDRIEYFAEAGWDTFHFESQVDAYEAKKIVGDRMSLMGNLNNSEILFSGDYDSAYEASMKVLEAGIDGLAPEGSVPLSTKMATLRALADAARDYSNAHRTNGRLVRHDPPSDPSVA
jgi:MtaA/CmuA family methyltransferase